MSVGDSALRTALASPAGFGFIGGTTYAQIRAYNGAKNRVYCLGKEKISDGGYGFFEVDVSDTTSADNGGTILVDVTGRRWKRQFSGPINLIWFAKGDGTADDKTALQNAVNATPWGGDLFVNTPPVYYKVSSETVISRPINIYGSGGSCVTSKQLPCIKASGHNNIFKLRATLDGYMFGAYGVTGVHMRDLMLEGPALNNNGFHGICTDETVNSGVYHIRNNIDIPSSIGNPSSEGCKTVVGNCFILNGNDISVDKKATAFAGGFAWPMLISGNSFSQTKQKVLYLDAPTGPKEFDSKQFRLCSSNAFSPVSASGNIVGPIPDGMISDGWMGYNGYHEDGKVTLNATVLNTVPKNVMRFTVPAGKGCYIKYSTYSVPETTAAGVATTIAGIRFINAGTSGTIKEDQGYGGTLIIPRQNNSLDIVVALWSNSATTVGVAEVDYCIM